MRSVTLITATQNRRQFLQNLINIVKLQDYDHTDMEWVIMDDSPESNEDIFKENMDAENCIDGILVRYYHFKHKIPLAKKRDLLNYEAKGEYIVNMDDDDYYFPTRVSHSIDILKKSSYQIAGNTKMLIYYTMDRTIYMLGPYGKNHGTAATMAYTKEYAKTHHFYSLNNHGKGNYAEEAVFTNDWKENMVQLDTFKTVIALSHSSNTVDKTIFLQDTYGQIGKTIRPTELKLRNLVTDDSIAKFYTEMSYTYKENKYTEEIKQKIQTTVIKSGMAYIKNAGDKYSELIWKL